MYITQEGCLCLHLSTPLQRRPPRLLSLPGHGTSAGNERWGAGHSVTQRMLLVIAWLACVTGRTSRLRVSYLGAVPCDGGVVAGIGSEQRMLRLRLAGPC